MPELFRCPTAVPEEIERFIIAAADAWAFSALRPKLSLEAAIHWDRVIREWLEDETVPLYVRKMSRNRGQVIKHVTGRILIPADNSPAHWSYCAAFSDLRPSLTDIKRLIDNDEIPVAMAMSTQERQAARYRCMRSSFRNPNRLNWKVCHKQPVALRSRGHISQMPIDVIRRHFYDFLLPSNMFLVPKKLSGLGEVPQFIEVMREYQY